MRCRDQPTGTKRCDFRNAVFVERVAAAFPTSERFVGRGDIVFIELNESALTSPIIMSF